MTTHSLIQHQLSRWEPYLALMRLDRPVGTLLLLWPTLAALWIAAEGPPGWRLLVVFTLGTFLMRAAGCVINDFADRHWDGAVRRTAQRPLATGAIAPRKALLLFAVLAGLAACLLLFLNNLTRWLAVGGLGIATLYPFMKRWTYLPQVALGAAFSWGIVMAFAAVGNSVPAPGWLMFVASVVWIVGYDTLYAMVDREDDLQVGIKSTAILFGSADRFMVGVLQAGTIASLALLGSQLDYGPLFYLGLLAMSGLFVHQQLLIRRRDPAACFAAFTNNTWVGLCLFTAVVLETWVGESVQLALAGWL